MARGQSVRYMWAYLLWVAERHVVQPAGSSHGITHRRARKATEHARHAGRLSQAENADWSSATGGCRVQWGTAAILWHRGEVDHAGC